MEINQYKYESDSIEAIEMSKHGINWPIVYILHNDEEAYIGESANFSRRFKEHLKNGKRASLTEINIIDDDLFNKSAVLDIESELIRLMDADEKYTLQNIVLGQNRAHDYYQRSVYKKMMKDIWNHLYTLGIAKQEYITIQNTDLFIYSPYKTLTADQYEATKEVLYHLGSVLLNTPSTYRKQTSAMAIHGGAGTGKSIVAVYLLKVLCDIKKKELEAGELEELQKEDKYEEGIIEGLLKACNQKDYKIGLVIPLTSFRDTLKKVFRKVDGLQANMLVTPSDVANAYLDGEPYDIILVDEAQRLKRPVNIQNMGTFYQKNDRLGLKKTATELDWLLKCSSHQVFFYDSKQQVSGSDIPIDDLNAVNYVNEFTLCTQMRVKGGDAYMELIRQILANEPPKTMVDLQDYEVKIFDDVQIMCDEIKAKNDAYGLCRNVAGFAWPWKTKKKEPQADYDIEIENHRFIWNNSNSAWIAHANSINEIGSIHTMQGQDLNYAGLIIGKDLSYDVEKQRIVVNKKELYDVNAKRGLSDEQIYEHVLNAYYILLTRARRGVYLYICDENLKHYMKQFFHN